MEHISIFISLSFLPISDVKLLTAAVWAFQWEMTKKKTEKKSKFSLMLFGKRVHFFFLPLRCQLPLNEVLLNADVGIQRPGSSFFHKVTLLLITKYRPLLSTRTTHKNNMPERRQWSVPCDKNNRMSQAHKSASVCVQDWWESLSRRQPPEETSCSQTWGLFHVQNTAHSFVRSKIRDVCLPNVAVQSHLLFFSQYLK